MCKYMYRIVTVPLCFHSSFIHWSSSLLSALASSALSSKAVCEFVRVISCMECVCACVYVSECVAVIELHHNIRFLPSHLQDFKFPVKTESSSSPASSQSFFVVKPKVLRVMNIAGIKMETSEELVLPNETIEQFLERLILAAFYGTF